MGLMRADCPANGAMTELTSVTSYPSKASYISFCMIWWSLQAPASLQAYAIDIAKEVVRACVHLLARRPQHTIRLFRRVPFRRAVVRESGQSAPQLKWRHHSGWCNCPLLLAVCIAHAAAAVARADAAPPTPEAAV